MNKPVTNIAVTAGLASFDFSVTTTGISEKIIPHNSYLLYRFGPLDIIRDANGTIRKVINK